ncbi:hypothetical protein PL263_05145 [Methylomonas sp. EFPC3]|uniref:hypothetical protein n=1 Tax=Methylomonas sp. EFPC3 TaxID=3021710 RepID=UPI0024172159|nr:hypothetical protein [Methylomonas sp. EFPC3]WFP51416.1 hypothetical protein PL263_05145 [Methylomonas sp. EFPC3]
MPLVNQMIEQRRRRQQIERDQRLSGHDRIIDDLLGKEGRLRHKLTDTRWIAAIGWAAFAYLAYCHWAAPIMVVAGLECRL